MSDPRSPSRRDYREMMRGWSRVMEGRVVIYDYDQGMLIWRDLPNPSQHVLARDIGEYRRAGILGIDAEDRGAYATTFLNEYFRGQLYWNPDLDVDRELAEFYPAFYGPAAGPMAQYWTEIFQAWKDTSVTEHEFFVIPAVYPRSLVERLGKAIGQAGTPPEPYATRVQVARLSYQLLDAYTAMVEAACAQCDYTTASGAGARGLEIRGQLKKLSPILVNEFMESKTPPWWAGELAIYEGLAQLSEGPRGKLVVKTPLHWDYRPDPWDHGLWRDWARDQEAQGWQSVRTDLYLQAQPAILTQEFESPGGFGYYRCKVHLTREQVKGAVHVAFPGIFNDSWLYVNGKLLANRPQKTQWWANDYSFSWDVDLSERLHEGDNWLCVRTRVPQHLAGIFRRPFLYRLESP